MGWQPGIRGVCRILWCIDGIFEHGFHGWGILDGVFTIFFAAPRAATWKERYWRLG